MDQVSRTPGDTVRITRREAHAYYTSPNWHSTDQVSFTDSRPDYGYGAVVNLGDRKYRQPTNYRHSAYETRIESPYIGQYTSKNGSIKRRVEDHGRESAAVARRHSNSLFGGGEHPSTSSSHMNEAIVKALLDIAGQKAGIGEDLATFGQTLRLFTSKGSLLLAALRAMKSRRQWWQYMKRSARELRKDTPGKAAQTYIEYVYGLRPLVQDVYGISELLKEQGQRVLLLHGKGQCSRTESDSKPWRGALTATRERLHRSEETGRFRCDLWAKLDPEYAGLRALNQLGLLNPAELAWNLVPWSFVVDWFAPVGSVLGAFSAPVGLKFVSGTKSARTSGNRSIEFQVQSTFYRATDPLSKEESPGWLSVQYEGYQRTRLSTWPLPGFYFAADPFAGDRPLKALALGVLQLQRWSRSPR